jgi:Tol biopolymer transport system component/DNA-binding winged helix-turn-helix (wHTH) protein
MSSPRNVFEFGPYRLDPSDCLLTRHGQPIQLKPKVFDTLVVLLENSGRLISKDELMQRIWQGSAVEENNLNQNISALRKALGTRPDGGNYIETIPKRGYRFADVVTNLPGDGLSSRIDPHGAATATIEPAVPAFDSGSIGAEPFAADAGGRRRSRFGVWKTAAAAALALVAGVSTYQILTQVRTSVAPMNTVPLTSWIGNEITPALSPQGDSVAYAWDDGKDAEFDIYVQEIGAATPRRVTDMPGTEVCPAWSPDGRRIAFVHYAEGESGLFVVAAMGGTPRRLRKTSWRSNWAANYSHHISWSPDGTLIAFSDQPSPGEPTGIFVLSVDGLDTTRLTSCPSQSADAYPCFSPDGRAIAFTRCNESAGDVYVVSSRGGEPRRVTYDDQWIMGLDWIAGGQQIVFSSIRGGPSSSLWTVPAAGGEPRPLALGQNNVTCPSVARRGGGLAYAHSVDDSNIWRIRMPGQKDPKGTSTRLIGSTQWESGPQFSPDGQKIVFQSGRSGANEIWVCDSNGLNPVQMTRFGGLGAGTPRWSPDGRRIAFDARTGGNTDIYVIYTDGGTPLRITADSSDDVVPSWSRDGKWIYFCSNRSGISEIWKVPADGGEPVQVTSKGGFAAFESVDQKSVYYVKFDSPGIWQTPVQGGDERLILGSFPAEYWGYWVLMADGIFVVNAKDPGARLEFFSFESRRTTLVTQLPARPCPWVPGLDVDPKRQSAIYVQLDVNETDIKLVENFR